MKNKIKNKKIYNLKVNKQEQKSSCLFPLKYDYINSYNLTFTVEESII